MKNNVSEHILAVVNRCSWYSLVSHVRSSIRKKETDTTLIASAPTPAQCGLLINLGPAKDSLSPERECHGSTGQGQKDLRWNVTHKCINLPCGAEKQQLLCH